MRHTLFRAAARQGLVYLVLGALGVAGGCSGGGRDEGNGRLVGGSPGRGIAEERAKFETVADPPLQAETRFAAGWLAENQGDLGLAIRQYREALQLDPRHSGAMYRLGVLYTRLQDKPKAMAAWQDYLRVTNESASGYANLGFCHEMFKDYDEAERAYLAGIGKDPENRACRVNYGLMLARRGRVTEAMDQLGAVLTPAQVHYNLGSVFEQQGNADRARREYRAALSLDPGFEDAKVRLEDL